MALPIFPTSPDEFPPGTTFWTREDAPEAWDGDTRLFWGVGAGKPFEAPDAPFPNAMAAWTKAISFEAFSAAVRKEWDDLSS